jgi:polyisoprenoid-binding protein YceI
VNQALRRHVIGSCTLLLLLVAVIPSCTHAPRDAVDIPTVKPTAAFPGSFPLDWYKARQFSAGSRSYSIDPKSSLLTIKVYRAGRLARYGHNHVISTRNINGRIYIDQDFAKSRIDAYIPVSDLVVDDPSLRAQAGEDFSTHLTKEAVDQTRSNMLSERVLDIENHPFLSLSASPVHSNQQQPEMMLRVTIRSKEQTLPHKPELEIGPKTLTASGEFMIRQSDFGIEPFSVMMGALRVQDELSVEYRIKAVRLPQQPD